MSDSSGCTCAEIRSENWIWHPTKGFRSGEAQCLAVLQPLVPTGCGLTDVIRRGEDDEDEDSEPFWHSGPYAIR